MHFRSFFLVSLTSVILHGCGGGGGNSRRVQPGVNHPDAEGGCQSDGTTQVQLAVAGYELDGVKLDRAQTRARLTLNERVYNFRVPKKMVEILTCIGTRFLDHLRENPRDFEALKSDDHISSLGSAVVINDRKPSSDQIGTMASSLGVTRAVDPEFNCAIVTYKVRAVIQDSNSRSKIPQWYRVIPSLPVDMDVPGQYTMYFTIESYHKDMEMSARNRLEIEYQICENLKPKKLSAIIVMDSQANWHK